MALAGPLIPIDDLGGRTATSTPDAQRLLRVSYEYLESLSPRPVLAVCVFSSVAWGIASPVSDLDVGLIVPEDTPACSEKRLFGETFVDHCEWPFSSIADLTENPLRNPLLSYTTAFALILFDPRGGLAGVQRRLAPLISQAEGANRWVAHYLSRADRLRAEARQRLGAGPQADVASPVFEAVRRLSDAVLHAVPGGHCGEWPCRLRETAGRTARPWLVVEATEILAPNGVDLPALALAVDPIEQLHRRTAAPPRGSAIGCSETSAAFFARKARYHAARHDALPLLHVLRRQLGYIDESLNARRGAGDPALLLPALTAERERIRTLLRRAWPWDFASASVAVERLDRYAVRIVNALRRR